MRRDVQSASTATLHLAADARAICTNTRPERRSILQRSPVFDQIRTIVDMSVSKLETARRHLLADPAAANSPASPAAYRDKSRARNSRRRPRRPEPGSIYGIMREHSGAMLYVLPICWTDAHARLLGAEFVALPPVLTPMPSQRGAASSRHGSGGGGGGSLYPTCPPAWAAALGRDLTALLSLNPTRPYVKALAIKSVLSMLYPSALTRSKTAVELDLHFGGRVFRKAIRIPVLWRSADAAIDDWSSFDSVTTVLASSSDRLSYHSNSSSQTAPVTISPVLVYINRTQLAFIRQNLFRIVPGPEGGDQLNEPVSRLQQLRSKLLIPEDVDHDAHFVAILLAMAQAHFYPEAPWAGSQQPRRTAWADKRTPTPAFRDVKVQILTHADDTAQFVVYTAVVTAAFLKRFAEPSRAPMDGAAAAGIKIEYAKVPIWPVLGLKERLAKALGRDIVGDVADDGSMETWESPIEREHRVDTLKRKRADRGTLAELLYGRFETEGDSGGSSGVADEQAQAQTQTQTPQPQLQTQGQGRSPRAKRRRANPAPSLEVC